MTTQRLYGARTSGVGAVADQLGTALGCAFEERESDYLGVYRLARLPDGTLIRVVGQPDPEGLSLEEEFADYATLIYVDGAVDLPGALDRLRT